MIVYNHKNSQVLTSVCFFESRGKIHHCYTMLMFYHRSEQSPSMMRSMNLGFLGQKAVYTESEKMTPHMLR